MFRFPDGSEIWPSIGNPLTDLLRPEKWQVAQVGPLEIEIRYVPGADSTAPDCATLTEHIRTVFRQDVTVRYRPLQHLEQLPGGKFYDYVCELRAGRGCSTASS
jgi:phenylacetate-CoA ligase